MHEMSVQGPRENDCDAARAPTRRIAVRFRRTRGSYFGGFPQWTRLVLASAVMLAGLAGIARAADIKVIGSPGTRAPYTLLVPAFEKATGHKVSTTWGGVTEIAKRVAGGETADIVMLPAAQIDDLIRLGKLVASSRVDVARSGIGVAIRIGAPKIDAASSDGIRKALLAARTIAFSAGPSGVHVARLIEKWGIADEVRSKIVPPVPNLPIGEMVARGDAEIGFQQVSELLPVKGIDYLGPLPADIQEITQFSAALHRGADPAAVPAARALLEFLTAPTAAPTIRQTGMEPG
jgi:molybdate transport system substrate-binding protein